MESVLIFFLQNTLIDQLKFKTWFNDYKIDHSLILIIFYFPGLTKLLVGVGTITGGILSREFEVIDLESPKTRCQTLPNFPKHASNAFGGLAFQDRPLICGGFETSAGIGTVSKECHIYENGAWSQFHDLIEPRTFTASVTLESLTKNSKTIFVLGGNSLNTAEMATEHGWETVLPNVPVNTIDFHCMVQLNSTTVMVIGGSQGRESQSPKTYFFNMESKVWSEGPQLHYGRSGHGCATIRRDNQSDLFSVIVAGGVTLDHVRTAMSLHYVHYSRA